mmetsp:Transcript_13494/g.51482  ORF Transcript_13494/g.51482 Transcript_13494/m.51482 type:complete len:535 (-) Transcript_13494:422-2026(-)
MDEVDGDPELCRRACATSFAEARVAQRWASEPGLRPGGGGLSGSRGTTALGAESACSRWAWCACLASTAAMISLLSASLNTPVLHRCSCLAICSSSLAALPSSPTCLMANLNATGPTSWAMTMLPITVVAHASAHDTPSTRKASTGSPLCLASAGPRACFVSSTSARATPACVMYVAQLIFRFLGSSPAQRPPVHEPSTTVTMRNAKYAMAHGKTRTRTSRFMEAPVRVKKVRVAGRATACSACSRCSAPEVKLTTTKEAVMRASSGSSLNSVAASRASALWNTEKPRRTTPAPRMALSCGARSGAQTRPWSQGRRALRHAPSDVPSAQHRSSSSPATAAPSTKDERISATRNPSVAGSKPSSEGKNVSAATSSATPNATTTMTSRSMVTPRQIWVNGPLARSSPTMAMADEGERADMMMAVTTATAMRCASESEGSVNSATASNRPTAPPRPQSICMTVTLTMDPMMGRSSWRTISAPAATAMNAKARVLIGSSAFVSTCVRQPAIYGPASAPTKRFPVITGRPTRLRPILPT